MQEKHFVIWGVGKIGRQLLKNKELKTAFAIDRNLSGSTIDGIEIKTPDEIKDWKDLYVCITTSKYEQEIKEELESKGLVEEQDFISYREMERQKLLMNHKIIDVNNALVRNLLSEKEIEQKIKNRMEWECFCSQNSAINIYSKTVSDMVKESPKQTAPYAGYCEVCGQNSIIKMDFRFTAPDAQVNWRESASCLKCGCNGRLRLTIGHLESIYSSPGIIYINECITNTYRILKRKYPNIIGSEYFGSEYKSGEEVNGMRNEDATNLSFHDESIDYYVSNDVFEHVSDYKKAYAEAYRVLKKKGRFIFSVPFDTSRDHTQIRARIDNEGNIEHLLPPAYHKDPLSEDGTLVFNDFGWDMLSSLYEVGFDEAYMLYRFSADKAYLGHKVFIFEAKK